MKREPEDKNTDAKEYRFLPTGIGIGIAIGAGIGIALDNIAIGMGVGITFGVAIGIILSHQDESNSEDRHQ